MFDIGWPEFLVVAVIALFVIGPRDLPKALHTVGRWVGKARKITREFQRQFDDVVRESELEELKKGVDTVRSINPKSQIKKFVDPKNELNVKLDPTEGSSPIPPKKTAAVAEPGASSAPDKPNPIAAKPASAHHNGANGKGEASGAPKAAAPSTPDVGAPEPVAADATAEAPRQGTQG